MNKIIKKNARRKKRAFADKLAKDVLINDLKQAISYEFLSFKLSIEEV